MHKRGDLTRFGRHVVEHTRQTNLQRVVVLEHYMHLLSGEFYALVDAAIEDVCPAGYTDMFAHFTDEFRRRVESSKAPAHYRQAYRELGESMQRWSDAFRAHTRCRRV